jgi:hypothetical protein
LRLREDVTWEDVKEQAKSKKPFSQEKKIQSSLKKQVKNLTTSRKKFIIITKEKKLENQQTNRRTNKQKPF